MMKQRAKDYVELKGEERIAKEREVYYEELRKIIERELLLYDFLAKIKKNKPQLLPELWEQAGRMTDGHMRELRKFFGLNSETELTEELEKQGLSYKLFRRAIERNTMVNLFLSSMLKEKNGTPTLAQVQSYYEQNPDEFKTEDRVKFLHFFVSAAKFNTTDEAKQYATVHWKSALDGADFAKLVTEHGHGDSTLRNGAGVGEKRGEIHPPGLEETIFSVKAGNISGVVATETGYHFVKVTERTVAGQQPLDEKLQSDIRNKLQEKQTKLERDKLVTNLWRQIGVVIDASR
jgi:hypothetical protein